VNYIRILTEVTLERQNYKTEINFKTATNNADSKSLLNRTLMKQYFMLQGHLLYEAKTVQVYMCYKLL